MLLEKVKMRELELVMRLFAGELDSSIAIQLINEIEASGFKLEAARLGFFLFEEKAFELFPELRRQLEYIKQEEGDRTPPLLLFEGAVGSPGDYIAAPGD